MSVETHPSQITLNTSSEPAVGLRVFVRDLLKTLLPARWYWRLLMWQVGHVDPELDLLRYICDKNKASVDVGASGSNYTVHLLKHSKRCYAFEPLPDSAARLERRLIARPHPRLRVETAALSDRSGPLRLKLTGTEIHRSLAHGGAAQRTSTTETLLVPTRRLDDSIAVMEPVGCMKIDAAGREAAVLRGAEKILLRDSPSLIIEMGESRRPGSLTAVRRYLAEFGYQGFFFKGGCLRPIESMKVDKRPTIGGVAKRSAGRHERCAHSFLFFAGASLPEMRHLIEGHV